MGIITSKRKVDLPGCTGTITDTRYEKLRQEDSTICDEKSPSVLGKDIDSTKITEQILTPTALDTNNKLEEKQANVSTRQTKSSTDQHLLNKSSVSHCNGHPSHFSIPIEPKSLLENPLLKRAEGESKVLKPVNPFRIGKEKDKERIELFESGLVNPHNRAGIIRHELDPKEEEIIGELKGIGIISKREQITSEKANAKNRAPLVTEVPVELESTDVTENVHVLSGLSDTSLNDTGSKQDNAPSDLRSPQKENTSNVTDRVTNAQSLALKMIDMDVL